MTNAPVRATTAGEYTKFRSENQFARLNAYIFKPATIYTMRINQTFVSLDSVYEFIYDNGTGTLADVEVGMTILVSATAFGNHDKGIMRVRKSPTATILYFNEVSHIQFAENDYITIINSFSIWQRDIFIAGAKNIYMDRDVTFGNYLNGFVVPRVGGIVAVVFLDPVTGEVEFNPVDPSLSEGYIGATIVSYHYDCQTALSVADADTTSPTFTFDTAGEHRFTVSITDSIGRVTKTHRWVLVSPTATQSEITNWQASFDSGGWSFSLKTYEDVSDIYDRAMVVFYTSIESYGGVQGAFGKLDGYENVVAVGWVDGKTISLNQKQGFVEFTVKDASYWLSKIRSFPFGVEDTSTAPINWVEVKELTVDKALNHLLGWCSTIFLVMDCFFTGNTWRVKELQSPADNLWAQITEITFATLFAKPIVNSLGQLFVSIDAQILSDTDRTLVTNVMNITKNDIEGEIQIELLEDQISLVDLSGISQWTGTKSSPLFSKAPGSIGSNFGSPVSEDNYLFLDQDECNRICGLLYAIQNTQYGAVDINLGFQNKLIDIAPTQFCTLTIPAIDSPAGIAFTSKRMIPRAINCEYDAKVGMIKSSVTFDFLVEDAVDGITYIPPVVSNQNVSTHVPNSGGGKPNGTIYFPPVIPDVAFPAGCGPLTIDGFTAAWDVKEVIGADSTKLIAKCYFPCTIHGGTTYPTDYIYTTLVVNGWFGGDSALPTAQYTLYGVKDGVRVITATQFLGARWHFVSSAPVAVDGFELELNAGAGSVVTYTPMDEIDTGTVAGNNAAGVNVAVVEGQSYCIEGTGGPWLWQVSIPSAQFYNFWRGAGQNPFLGIGKDASGVMHLDIPSGCLFSEVVEGNYGRTYFIADATNVFNFCVSDFLFGDNAGSLGYILRDALIDSRRILLTSLGIYNVCG